MLCKIWEIFCDNKEVNNLPRFFIMCLYWFTALGFCAIGLWPLWVFPLLAIYRIVKVGL